MQRLGYTGTVYPINPKYKEIFGYPCYASLRDLPAPADCATVLLGSRSLLPMLEEAHAAGVKGVWGFASGFAETGGEGRAMQRRIHDFCHESGLLFCGPNCVGYANITDKTCMYSAPLPQAFRPGDIGVIAQSGAVLLALGNANRMAGFSRLISSGNEAALGLADYMDYLVDDDATHVIALFIETIRDRKPAAACSRAAEGQARHRAQGRALERACRVAAHTEAIAGSDRILDAFFRRANVMRVNTLDDLLETAVLFSGLRGLSAGSPKVGMATVSGGEMGMLADVCADSGLVFPPVSEAGKERLRKVLPPYAPIANPLDAWGSGDLREAYPASLGILAAEEDVETLIVSQDIPGNMAPEQVEQFSDVARAAVAVRAASGKPVIVVSNISGGIDPAIGDILAQGNVPVVQGSGAGIPAIRRWIDWCAARAAKTASPYPRKDSPTPSILPPELASELDASSGVLPYSLSARLLRHFGIAIDHEELAVSLEEGMAAAGRIGYPVALKAASPTSRTRPRQASSSSTSAPARNSRRHGASLKASLPCTTRTRGARDARARHGAGAGGKSGDVVETIVGVNRDGGFGSAVMVGLGGVFVELLRDVSLELAPLSPEGARAMIGRLKAAKLLTGFRGRAASDVEALSDVLVRVAAMCCALGDRLVSLDLNPVMVLPEGKAYALWTS
ncbi:MAG: acetate--CoA ligase family protein [Bilophila wadsworthia]